MGFLNDMLGNLLPDKKEEETGEPEVILREAIQTTKTVEKDFEAWLARGMQGGLLAYLKECIEERQANPAAEVNLYVHQSKHSNGFYFRAESPWTTEDYQFLIFFILKKLKALGYVQSHATREVVEDGGILKTEEEYFLKPSLRFRREIPYEQLFGNVFIEHRIKGENTELVKIMVNTYTDHHYKKPYDFEDFLREICLP